MSKRKAYAIRLNKSPEDRMLIVILRIACFSQKEIAYITGRHVRTIANEFKHPKHLKLFRICIKSVGKKYLTKEMWKELDHELAA